MTDQQKVKNIMGALTNCLETVENMGDSQLEPTISSFSDRMTDHLVNEHGVVTQFNQVIMAEAEVNTDQALVDVGTSPIVSEVLVDEGTNPIWPATEKVVIDAGVDATLPAPLLLSGARSNFATEIPSLLVTPAGSQELEVYHGQGIEWPPASTGQAMSLTPIHEVDTPNTDELEGFINEVLGTYHSAGVSPIPEASFGFTYITTRS